MADQINDTTRVLRAVQTLVDKHAWFPTPEDRDAVVLWGATQWVAGNLQSFGRIYFQSSEPGSGKSESMRLLTRLARVEVNVVNATPAVIYRIINKFNGTNPPTLGLDEADKIWGRAGSASKKTELLSVANAGYERSGYVWKPRGQDDVEQFPCYAPMAFAGLGTLPEDLFTRCITINMRRAPKEAKFTPYNVLKHKPLFDGVKEQLETWSRKVENEIRIADPELPEGVSGRLAQVWYGMVAVADLADADDWSVRARKALVAIGSRKRTSEQKSPTGEFLKVIVKGFENSDRLFTKDIAAAMGDGYTTKQVGSICRDLEVLPRVMKIGGKSGTGVMKSDFEKILTLLGKE